MDAKEFNKIVEKRIDKIRSVLIEKAKEYASDQDRLHNFKVAARISGETPEKALDGMMLKQYVSYRDIIEKVGHKGLSLAIIDEKITDMINYLILFEALIMERVG